jgi:hypothetical protein
MCVDVCCPSYAQNVDDLLNTHLEFDTKIKFTHLMHHEHLALQYALVHLVPSLYFLQHPSPLLQRSIPNIDF